MYILGIQVGHDATAALLKDGEVVAAIGEERLSRVKFAWGCPSRAISKCLRMAGIGPADIDVVAVSESWFPSQFARDPQDQAANMVLIADLHKRGVDPCDALDLDAYREEAGFVNADAVFVDHHLGHAASAYFTSGWERGLAITVDATDGAICATVNVAKDNEITRLAQTIDRYSPGYFYIFITEHLGFRRNRHEGKIVGLASYGDPSVLYDDFKACLDLNEDKTEFCYGFDPRTTDVEPWQDSSIVIPKALLHRIENESRERVAAAGQKLLEDVVTEHVRAMIERTGETNVLLAGGVFANVKLNQRIIEIPEATDIFIHPNMGDAGTALGAAFMAWRDRAEKTGATFGPFELDNVYFGPSYSVDGASELIGTSYPDARHVDDVEAEIAKLLAEGKVVGRFTGRMEYGPRALGNRSILAAPTDPSINDWLNERLQRTEFMPFAPSVINHRAAGVFHNYEQSAYAARFMTITYDVAEGRDIPAVVHTDETARPQVVKQNQNPSYYRIIQEFEKLTGLPCILNTSFNLHEEPIVCTPLDAVAAFEMGSVDVLAIDNWLIEFPQERQAALPDMRAGLKAVRARSFVAAEEHFRAALAVEPTSAPALYYLGRSLAAQERDEEAIPHFVKATKSCPAYSKAWVGLCDALLKTDQPQQLIEAARTLTALDAELPEGWIYLGMGWLKLGEFSSASEAFEKARVLDPEGRDVKRGLGLLRENMRERFVSLAYPRLVVVDVIRHKCNLQCIYCTNRKEDHLERKEMEMATFQKIVDQLPNDSSVRLVLTGYGEPLLASGLMDMIEYAKTQKPEVHVEVVTNGHFLTEERAEQLAHSKLDHICISVSAYTPETYEKVTGSKGFEKMQARVEAFLNKVRSLPEPRLKTEVHVISTPDTRREFADFQAKWQGLADTVGRYVFLNWGGRITEDDVDFEIPMPTPRYACAATTFNLNVDVDGNYVPCCGGVGANAVDLGNVHERSIFDAWTGQEFEAIRQEQLTGVFKVLPLCEGCNYWSTYPAQAAEEMAAGMGDKSRRVEQLTRLARKFADAELPRLGTEVMSRLREIGIDSEDTALEVGSFLFEQGDYVSALKTFATGLQHNPSNPEHYNRLGETLVSLSRPGDARRMFEQALALDPENTRARSHLAVLS